MIIDSNSKVPKYIQINKWIHGMISRGKYIVGDQIPTEEELARMFGVNRMTVRQAIDELSTEKMIARKRGKGTFLIAAKPQDLIYELGHISSFTDDMKSLGITPKTTTLKFEVIKANKKIEERLHLRKNEKVIYTLRAKYADDEPVLIERSYLPHLEFKAILDMRLDGSLYHLLVEKFNITLHHSTQIFSSALCSKEDMTIFNRTSLCPCIVVESTIYDSNNIPIEVLYSHFRGDKYRFKANSGEYLFEQ